MKRFLIITIMALTSLTSALAQSMSDSQIVTFIQKEQKKGTSQAQIVTKLMQRGVSVTRLQKLRKQYQSAGSATMGSQRGVETASEDSRQRSANGTSQRMGEGGSSAIKSTNVMGMNESYGIPSSRLGSKGDNADANADDESQMLSVLNDFMPDSSTNTDLQIAQKEKNRKKVFGRDIFNNQNLSFEPNMNIATPQNYVLGPGDAVYIDVYGASQKSVQSTVSPDGYINIDGFGPVQVSGLTVSQANARLRSTLGARYSSSNIKLTLGQTRTIMVNVMGEVKAPGTYTLSAFASVFHALYMAGGTSEIGTLRNIKVYRAGRLVSNVDIYDYILNGKLTGNVRLADNDVIVVGPYDCLVSVTGKVKRPMYYEMKKSESVQTLLKYAGGFTGDAYTKSVRLLRKNGKEFGVYNVTEFDMASFRVSDEDSVSVDAILPRLSNTVELKGAVFRPGLYQLGGDVTTVKGLIETADGLSEDAFSQHAVMHRMKADRTLEVMSLDIQGILNGTVADIPLRNEDVLFIPSKKDLNDERKLKIYGEVYYPGTYQYADGMTVEDFILQAGGMKDGASNKVKVSRRVLNPSAQAGGDQAARLEDYEMTLVDGFVVDGQPGFKLQPFDEVFVTKTSGYTEQSSVSVEGEVLSSGFYGLNGDNVRVSDVLKMAGGITPRAATNGAYIMRKMNDEERRRRENMLLAVRANRANAYATATTTGADDRYLFADSLTREQYLNEDEYRVAVNLQNSLKNPGCADDVILRDNDRLIVEPFNNTVKISGAVPYTNTVPYVKGKGIKYYMQQGGARGRTNRKWAYVVYQNGSAQMIKDGAKIEPGCEIVLPERHTTPNTQSASMWVSIGSTIATMAAVVVTAIK
ncbi:MAG: SLBB domain-containing protein [Prevotella sp.]|nr:SLBB domain-containing protein [Prevotella sp.]